MSDYLPVGLTGSLVGRKTLTATPAALHAGASEKTPRSRLRITNEASATRIRIGAISANLQRDGLIIEPGDTATIYPSATVYGCSEGKPAIIQIEEK